MKIQTKANLSPTSNGVGERLIKKIIFSFVRTLVLNKLTIHSLFNKIKREMKIFDSSVVEQSAVNRLVVGSNPTRRVY